MNPTPSLEIHAHDVIDLIRNARPALTLQTVAAAIERQFGPAARFHTCSTAGMTAEQTVHFLLSRRKVSAGDTGELRVQEANVCQH